MFSAQLPPGVNSAASIDWATLAQQWIQMREENVPGAVDTGSAAATAAALHAVFVQQQQQQLQQQPARMSDVPPPPSMTGHGYTLPTSLYVNNFTMVPRPPMSNMSMKSHQPFNQTQQQHVPSHSQHSQQPAAHQQHAYEEKGEADMDMDDDDGTGSGRPPHLDSLDGGAGESHNRSEEDESPPPAPSMQLPAAIMQRAQAQVPANWPSGGPKQRGGHKTALPMTNNALTPTPVALDTVTAEAPWSAGPAPVWPAVLNRSSTGLPKLPAAPVISSLAHNTTAHIPSLLKLHVANPNTHKAKLHEPLAREEPCTATHTTSSANHNNHNNNSSNNAAAAASAAAASLDAAKRKMLPAWIREGLEKMEREKQRQLEREQLEQQQLLLLDGKPSWHEDVGSDAATKLTVKCNTATLLTSDIDDEDAVRAVEDDNDHDVDDEDDNSSGKAAASRRQGKMPKLKRHSKDADAGLQGNKKHVHAAAAVTAAKDDDDDDDDEEDNGQTIPEEPDEDAATQTYEQNVADLMIVVRRTLTELLLEVTNDEIAQLSLESIKAQKTKASSAQVIRKSALSSITGKLGLAAYADSSGSSDEDEENNDDDNDGDEHEHNSSVASDGTVMLATGNAAASALTEEELRATIRMKKRAWAKIAAEIEDKLANATEREDQKLKFYTEREQERNSRRSQQDGGGGGGRGHGPLGKSYARDFGETTTTESKLPHSNGKQRHQRAHERQQRKERTTRFSDNKDTGTLVTSMAYLAQMQEQRVLLKNTVAGQSSATPSSLPPPSVNLFPIAAAAATSLAGGDANLSQPGRQLALSSADAPPEKASKGTTSSSSTTTTTTSSRRERRERSKDRRSDERQREREHRRRYGQHKGEKKKDDGGRRHRSHSRRRRRSRQRRQHDDRDHVDRSASERSSSKRHRDGGGGGGAVRRDTTTSSSTSTGSGGSDSTSQSSQTATSTSSSSSSSASSSASSSSSRSASLSMSSDSRSTNVSAATGKPSHRDKKSKRKRSRSRSRKSHHQRPAQRQRRDERDATDERRRSSKKSKTEDRQRRKPATSVKYDRSVSQRSSGEEAAVKQKQHRRRHAAAEETSGGSTLRLPSRSRSHSRSSYASSSRHRKH